MIINNVLTMNAPDSANVSAHHIPSIPPKRAGKNSTAATWKTQVLKNDYLPRCQISRSYSAMVRSEENMPALAMFTRHLRRQPVGSQA